MNAITTEDVLRERIVELMLENKRLREALQVAQKGLSAIAYDSIPRTKSDSVTAMETITHIDIKLYTSQD